MITKREVGLVVDEYGDPFRAGEKPEISEMDVTVGREESLYSMEAEYHNKTITIILTIPRGYRAWTCRTTVYNGSNDVIWHKTDTIITDLSAKEELESRIHAEVEKIDAKYRKEAHPKK